MEAGHLLLERPQEYDRDATHCEKNNKYIFFINNKKFSLNSLTPSEVYECQVHLKKEFKKKKTVVKAQEMKAAKELKEIFVEAILSHKAKKAIQLRKVESETTSKLPNALHVDEQEIEEIVRKSFSTKRSLCLHVKNDKKK